MKKSSFNKLAKDSIAYIIAHGKYQCSRGRGLSVQFYGIRNPKYALELATQIAEAKVAKRSVHKDNYGLSLLKNSYVTMGGKISKHGSINIFDNSVKEPPATTKAMDYDNDLCLGRGLELWSSTLYSFRKGGFKAIILPHEEVVLVVNKKNRPRAVISSEHLSSVMMCLKETVTESGWLLSNAIIREALINALSLAEKGKKPPFCDNSAFLKVSTHLAKNQLLVLYMEKDEHKVFDSDGKLIPHKTHYPLSYKRWRPDSSKAAHSRG